MPPDEEPPFDQVAAVKELQLASIPDIQGSIHADDSKASVGLVVHGLLFAGLVSVVSNLGDLYADVEESARIAGWVLLGAASVAFVLSILALINAARPHSPDHGLATDGAFFPRTESPPRGWWRAVGRNAFGAFRLRGEDPSAAKRREDQTSRLKGLEQPRDFVCEYAGEQVKLINIHEKQARRITSGFWWLRVEVGFVAAFLLLVAAASAGAGRADGSALHVRWTVRDGIHVHRVTGTQTVPVRRAAAVTVVVRLKGRDAKRLELTGSRTCRPRKGPARPAQPIADHSETLDDADEPTVAATITPASCPRGARRGVRATLFAVGRSDDDLVTARLRLAGR
jgi:hypothetical protein